jgi:hypothetical protein
MENNSIYTNMRVSVLRINVKVWNFVIHISMQVNIWKIYITGTAENI